MADQDLARIAEALDALNDRLAEMNYRICLLEGRPAVPPRPTRRFSYPVPPAAATSPTSAQQADALQAMAAQAAPLEQTQAHAQPQVQTPTPEVTQPVTELPPPAALPAQPVAPNPIVSEVVRDILNSGPEPAFVPTTAPIDPLASTAAPRTEKRIAEFIGRHSTPTQSDAPRGLRPPKGQPLSVNLEQALGKNWAAWLGGLIVVLGMLYFLKLVWDQEWFYLTPTARIGTAMFVGILFTAFGEALHFRKMSVLAGTLHGVGLAVVMASFFAAYTAFNPPVMTRTAALMGVLITGIAGVALSLHIRQITLAIIALLGMYLAPAVLRGSEDSSLAFLTYIAVITATGCTVAIVKPTWQWVRWTTILGTWLWTIAWATESHGALARAHFQYLLLFPAIYLIFFVIELLAGSYRAARDPNPLSQKQEMTSAAISLFINTCLTLGIIWVAFPPIYHAILYRIPLGLAAVMFVVWALTPGRIIKTTAVILATNLITFAVPMYFSADTATFAWAILSLALGLFSAVINSRIVHWWAFGVVGLVFVRLFSVDAANPLYREVAYHFLRKDITWWAIMAWGASVYAFAMSYFLKLSLKRLSPQPSTDLWTEDPLDALLIRSAAWTRFAAPAVFIGVGFYLSSDGAELMLLHALALAFFGYFAGDVVARFGATALIVGAAVAIMGYEYYNPLFHKVLFKITNEPVKLWMALPVAAAVVAHATAALARLRPGKEGKYYPFINSTIGTGMIVMGALGSYHDGANIMLVHAAILVVAALMLRGVILQYFAMSLLFACMTRIVFGTALEPLRQQAILFLILSHLLAIFIAARVKPTDKPEAIWPAWIAGGLGTLGFLLIGLRIFDPMSELTLVGIVVALVLFVLAQLIPGLGYRVQSSLLTAVLLFKWLIVDSLGTILLNDPYLSSPIVHLHTLNGILIAALVMMTPVPEELTAIMAKTIRFWVFVAMAFVWLNVETLCAVDSIMNGSIAWIGSVTVVKNTAISVLWGLVGFGFVLWGMMRKLPAHRWFGLWVLGFTVAKILIVDMANVETVLRIVSFIAVGILLLGVSFVYHRQSQKNGRNGNSQGDDFNGTNGANPKPANLV